MGVSAAGRPAPFAAMDALALEVGPTGPVAAVGGGTRGDLGGALDAGTRTVGAPQGILALCPEELVVTVGAGTPTTELEAALAEVGQMVALPVAEGSTVGGTLAAGHSSLHALALGPARDALLQARAVDAWGRVVTAGGPTVKNVSGFDLCRLLVGSLGTLALLGEVTLRTRPRWRAGVWVAGVADPAGVLAAGAGPTALLWDGERVWAHLAGHTDDVAAAAARLAALGCDAVVDGPPPLPPHRGSVAPSTVGELPAGHGGGFVAELGVGTVHTQRAPEAPAMPRRLHELHCSVKARFDPDGRLAPGRSPLHGVRVTG